MRLKLILPVIITLLALQTQAQDMWFEAGIKAGYGPTVLWESNISDSDFHDMNINSGVRYGLNLNVNFDQGGGIILETLITHGKQTFDYDGFGDILAGKHTIDWKSTDVFLLYRFVNRGAFIEIGPKMSFMGSVDHDLSNNPTNPFAEIDVESMYTDNYLSGVLGFGGYLFGSREFTVGLGLRFEYAFQNFTSDEGKEAGFPLTSALDSSYDPGDLRNINVYATLEIKIPIGRFSKIQCGQRGFLFGGG